MCQTVTWKPGDSRSFTECASEEAEKISQHLSTEILTPVTSRPDPLNTERATYTYLFQGGREVRVHLENLYRLLKAANHEREYPTSFALGCSCFHCYKTESQQQQSGPQSEKLILVRQRVRELYGGVLPEGSVECGDYTCSTCYGAAALSREEL